MSAKIKVLITGAAGFIGFHLSLKLLKNNVEVVALDNLNDYYAVQLKESRLELLKKNYIKFYNLDITDYQALKNCFDIERPNIVVHLAAQAGVRYSLENPRSYLQNNIVGFFNILEICKFLKITRLIYASSSSVYGNSEKEKFEENDRVDNPLNLYSESKKSNELMAYTYANLHKLPCVGLRFFTVYGPWGRPDMAYFKFTKNIVEKKPIEVYGNGEMFRDFTFIDDIINGILNIIKIDNDKLFSENTLYEIFNLGNNKPIKLNKFITEIEKVIGIKAKIKFLPIQPGDVKRTSASLKKIQSKINFKPKTNLEVGLFKFLNGIRIL